MKMNDPQVVSLTEVSGSIDGMVGYVKMSIFITIYYRDMYVQKRS